MLELPSQGLDHEFQRQRPVCLGSQVLKRRPSLWPRLSDIQRPSQRRPINVERFISGLRHSGTQRRTRASNSKFHVFSNFPLCRGETRKTVTRQDGLTSAHAAFVGIVRCGRREAPAVFANCIAALTRSVLRVCDSRPTKPQQRSRIAWHTACIRSPSRRRLVGA